MLHLAPCGANHIIKKRKQFPFPFNLPFFFDSTTTGFRKVCKKVLFSFSGYAILLPLRKEIFSKNNFLSFFRRSFNFMLEILKKYRVVPVIAIEDVSVALPLADALLEGGLPIAEITFRTEAAAEVIQILTEKRPELYVGAGTVLTHANIRDAIYAGAKFGVAPGLNAETLDLAEELEWFFIPGVCTPSEIESALSMNVNVLKFFPAGAMGGVAMLKALSAPYAHTGVRFMPTGGVSESNLLEYLAIPTVIACGGTWIATKNDLAEGNWNQIKQRCQQVNEIIAGK
jgi:2-dehydro-3-deoxyphosphogluconate aldolase/(4S)-4-hydroxy-2-oxoglutarate aldolase